MSDDIKQAARDWIDACAAYEEAHARSAEASRSAGALHDRMQTAHQALQAWMHSPRIIDLGTEYLLCSGDNVRRVPKEDPS